MQEAGGCHRLALHEPADGRPTMGEPLMKKFNDLQPRAMTRRRWLCIALAGASASVFGPGLAAMAGVEDEATPLKGRIFTSSINNAVNRAAGRTGPGVLDLESGTWSSLSFAGSGLSRVSPDGRFVAFFRAQLRNDLSTLGLCVFDVEGEHELKHLVHESAFPVGWEQDGTSIFYFKRKLKDGMIEDTTWRIRPDGTMPEQLPLPVTDTPIVVSPDGLSMLVEGRPGAVQAEALRGKILPVDLVSLDGKERQRMIDGYSLEGGIPPISFVQPRFTPDGRHVIYGRFDPLTRRPSVWSVGLDGKDRHSLIPDTAEERIYSFCIAPDGKSLAVVFVKSMPGEAGQDPTNSWSLSIVDIDAKHRRKLRDIPPPEYSLVDWRVNAQKP